MIIMNVAIVGAGEIAREHLEVWRKINNTRVIAVCDANKPRAQKMAENWKIPTYSDTLDEILRGKQISIVDICTPPQAHCSLAVQALDAGCNVVVEKPLAMTVHEAKAVLSRPRNSQTKVTVIHNFLYTPLIRRALFMIEKGSLGEVLSVEIKGLHTPDEPMLADRNHWCHSLLGGRLGEHLAHPIYLAQAILGHLKVSSVHAMKLGTYPWVSFDELRVILEADKGYASFYVSFNATRNDFLVDIYGTRGNLRVDVYGYTIVRLKYRPLAIFSKGVDNLSQISQQAFSTARGAVNKLSGRVIGGHEVCLRDFVNSVLNGKEPLVTLIQAYDTVELLEQICQEIGAQSNR